VAHFSSPENWLLIRHVYHANHHKLTTKTPRFGTSFCQNPQQKLRNTTPKKIPQQTSFFPLRLALFRKNEDPSDDLFSVVEFRAA
jgi:hypothetical protein